MPSSFTPNLGVELPADGELDGVWGAVVNENMEILDRAINGSVSLSLSGTSSTLTTTDGTLSNGQYKLLVLAGTPSGTHTITISPNDAQKVYFVRNTTAQSVVFTQGSGGNVTIAPNDGAVIYSNGGGATAAVALLSTVVASTTVPRTSTTGSALVPSGTQAQRDGSPSAGFFRFNSDVTKFEGYNGTAWGSVGGGATGGGADEIFVENGQTVTTNYTLTTNKNAMSVGPISINSGVTVTVPTGSNWVVL
jgi:hypothetical protein